MSRRTRHLAWAAAAVAAAWVVAFAVLSARSRYECNPGASTSGCETVDEILFLISFIALPTALVAVGLMLIVSLKGRR